MNGISISSYYQAVRERIRQDIVALEASQLEGTVVEEWIDFFMTKYAFVPIELKQEPPILEERVDKFQRTDIFDTLRTVERPIALVGLPVEPNINLKDLLSMRGETWILTSSEWEYRDGCIFVETDPNPDTASKAVENAKKNIDSLNKAINQGNAHLPNFIRECVQQRMDTVGARAQKFVDLAEALGAELKLSGEAERRISQVPQVKKSIAELRRPQPRQKAIPKLEADVFETILDIIGAQALTFERTPQTIAKLEEDDIRNLILSALNAVLNLGALGEAFSKQGKTDIYLSVPEGGIFIAECKVWHGPHTIGESIDQILGYLTWRDAYGVVIVFSRNKGFSGVLDAMPGAIEGHDSLRGKLYQIDEHHWSARHTLPGDEQQTIEMHYLVYNVYA